MSLADDQREQREALAARSPACSSNDTAATSRALRASSCCVELTRSAARARTRAAISGKSCGQQPRMNPCAGWLGRKQHTHGRACIGRLGARLSLGGLADSEEVDALEGVRLDERDGLPYEGGGGETR